MSEPLVVYHADCGGVMSGNEPPGDKRCQCFDGKHLKLGLSVHINDEAPSPTEGRDCCAFCLFSLKWQGPMERHADYQTDYIVCRRHAPVRPLDCTGHAPTWRQWPPVSNLDWCGDFERTDEERW